MDILIVGSYGVLTDALINKLNKEGNNVFVLMDEGYHGRKHKYVYEHYSFDYSSDSVRDVISSVKPACVIFTGANDTAFTWAHPNEEALRYVSACMNVALAAAALDVPRLICLSSNDVFEDSVLSAIDEDMPTTARSAKGTAIAQGEKIFLDSGRKDGMQVTVLRLDRLYGTPTAPAEVRSECSALCLDALRNGTVRCNGSITHSHLHVNDAAQAVLLVVNVRHTAHAVYHVTDGEVLDGIQMGRYLTEFDSTVSMNDDTGTEQVQLVLSGKRFNDEFSFSVFHCVADDLPRIYTYMKKRSRIFLAPDEAAGGFRQWLRRAWRAFYPFLENAAAAVLLTLLLRVFGGSAYIQRIDLYLIYTIIFAVLYGKTQGVFAAFLSVLLYVANGRDAGGILLDAGMYVWIAMLFILGMAIGHMKDRLSTSTQDKDDEITYLSGRLDDINAINRSNMRIKDVLKDQIVSYDTSLATLYRVASKLDKANPIDVQFYAAQMLQELLRARDVAIYRVVRGGFARLVTATTENAKNLGVSCDFEKFPEIFSALTKEQVYVNREMNRAVPMMVSATYDEGGMDMIIAVWNLHFEQMTMHEADLLTVLGHMIHDSVSRSNRYIDAVEMQKYPGCNRILNYNAFSEMVAVYRSAAKRGLAESAVLYVKNTGVSVEELDARLSNLIRESDFLGIDDKGRVYILLSNATPAEAELVIGRMKNSGIRCQLQEA